MKKPANYILLILVLNVSGLFGQWIKMDSLAHAVGAFESSGNHLFAGTNANGFYYSLDSGVTWTNSNQGMTHLNIRSISAKDSMIFIGCEGDVCKSTDFGLTWISSHNGIVGLDICSTLFIGDSLLIGSYGGGVFVSTDYGDNFTPLNNGLFDHYVKCLLFNGTRLFAGIQYGGSGIFVSDDNGATWMQKCTGIPHHPYNYHKYDDILSFTMTSQSIFASTFYNGVYKSDDNGESWTQVLIDNRATWILEGQEESVFSGHHSSMVNKSNDNGISWESCNDGIFGGDVKGLFIFGSYIFAGTSRGYVFRRPIDELLTGILEQNNFVNMIVYPNPVTELSKIVIPASLGDKFTLEIYNEVGQLVKRMIGLNCDQFEVNRNEFCRGIYFLRLTGSNNTMVVGKFIFN